MRMKSGDCVIASVATLAAPLFFVTIERRLAFVNLSSSGAFAANLLGCDEVFLAFVFTEGGTVVDLHQLNCETVEEAKARARRLAEDAVVKLWDWPVPIARFAPAK
jgi:hypothetical protein